MTLKGVFLDLDTVGFKGDVKLRALEKVLSILRVFGVTPAEKLLENVADAEVLILNKVKLPADTIRRFPAVRLICVAATGVNSVDLAAAWEKGIGVCNVPAYSTMAMAQHVFALLLALNQHLKEYEVLMQEGAWKRAPQFTLLDYSIRELASKRFGILGYGNTGKAVARVAEAFGMSVLVAARNKDDKRPGRLPLEELLPLVDVLSIHVPLLPETRRLIGPKELTLMKPDAVLINCARGAIVDERALATMLRPAGSPARRWTCSPRSRRCTATRCWIRASLTSSSRPHRLGRPEGTPAGGAGDGAEYRCIPEG